MYTCINNVSVCRNILTQVLLINYRQTQREAFYQRLCVFKMQFLDSLITYIHKRPIIIFQYPYNWYTNTSKGRITIIMACECVWMYRVCIVYIRVEYVKHMHIVFYYKCNIYVVKYNWMSLWQATTAFSECNVQYNVYYIYM